jgi:protein SCO1/2
VRARPTPRAYTHAAPAEKDTGVALQPVFVSVDPARDAPAQIARYLRDFHPRFVGLTGEYAAVKAACKAYRVYFSTPPGARADDDYLVDHSIFVYLLDPAGAFVEAFGQSTTAAEVVARTEKELAAWRQERGRAV